MVQEIGAMTVFDSDSVDDVQVLLRLLSEQVLEPVPDVVVDI